MVCRRATTLVPRQFGFRAGRGTEEALVSATEFVEKNLQQQRTIYGITLDVKAAFDSIHPKAVLDTLVSWDTPGYLIRWIASFFENRVATIELEGGRYRHQPRMGTPQGSPLSPLLFCIGINSLLNLPLMPRTHIQAYADDLLLLGTADSERTIQHKLQHWTLRMRKPAVNAYCSRPTNATKSDSPRECTNPIHCPLFISGRVLLK